MPKNLFVGEPDFRHGEIPAVGVLVVQLGTPAAPTARAVRAYLRQFLWDPRVIEVARPLWWLILNLFVLPLRPRRSAALYQKIWTPEGSPLLVISRRLAAALESELRQRVGTPLHVELGMNYGEPAIPAALAALRAKGCRRILLLPLFAHYSSSASGAAFDQVAKELARWRWVSELRTVMKFADEPAHVEALAASVRELWRREGEAEKLVFSFHGMPRRYLENGDPYHCLCQKTARLVAAALDLPAQRWVVTFQSRFGREKWLEPATDTTLGELARAGVKTLDVQCPGFTVDCLETLEEIAIQNRERFLEAGGERFRYVPALNDRPDQVAFLAELALRNLSGWVAGVEEWDGARAEREAEASRRRAEGLRTTNRE